MEIYLGNMSCITDVYKHETVNYEKQWVHESACIESMSPYNKIWHNSLICKKWTLLYGIKLLAGPFRFRKLQETKHYQYQRSRNISKELKIIEFVSYCCEKWPGRRWWRSLESAVEPCWCGRCWFSCRWSSATFCFNLATSASARAISSSSALV
jgi:hypothetical protein